jgi:hypothetical protein
MLLIQFLGRDFAHRTRKILLFLLTLRKVLDLLAIKQTDFPAKGIPFSRHRRSIAASTSAKLLGPGYLVEGALGFKMRSFNTLST